MFDFFHNQTNIKQSLLIYYIKGKAVLADKQITSQITSAHSDKVLYE
jgi:hypothetical protein